MNISQVYNVMKIVFLLNNVYYKKFKRNISDLSLCFTVTQETFEKNFEREAHKISEQNDADNASVISVSSNFEPFATDDLGKNFLILAHNLELILHSQNVLTSLKKVFMV